MIYPLCCSVGIAIYTISIFVLGALSLLSYKAANWALFIIPLMIWHRTTLQIIRSLFFKKHCIQGISIASIVPIAIILAILAILLLRILRPIPIGYDDSTYYLNIAKLIEISGSLVSNDQPYNGQLILSIGLLLFGNAKFALGMNLLVSLWALVAVTSFSRRYLSQNSTIWLVAILISLPSFVHQMGAEAKVDIPLLLFLTIGLDLIFTWSDTTDSKPQFAPLSWFDSQPSKLLLSSGLLTGFAVGVKYTVFIQIVGLVAIIMFHYFSLAGFLGVLGASLIAIFSFGLTRFTAYQFDASSTSLLIGIGISLTISSSIYVLLKKRNNLKSDILQCVISLCIFLGAIGISFSPWIIKHYYENRSTTFEALLFGKNESPYINWKEIHAQFNEPERAKGSLTVAATTADLKVKTNSSELYLETSRFNGSKQNGISLITAPYDAVMNLNVNSPMFEIGYILLLLPILLGIWLYFKQRYFLALSVILGTIIFGILSTGSAIAEKSCNTLINYECMNSAIRLYENISGNHWISVTGVFTQYFTKAIIVLAAVPHWVQLLVVSVICIATIIASFLYIEKSTNKTLILFCVAYIYIWILIGNGVYWYGMISFIILYIFVFIFLQFSFKNIYYKLVLYYTKGLIAIWLFFAVVAAFIAIQNTNNIIFPGFDDYILGKLNDEEVVTYTNPDYPPAIKAINADRDAFVYRIGTFLPYFIVENNRRIYNDNEARIFASIYNNCNSKEILAQILFAAGFRFIAVDTSLVKIDATGDNIMKSRLDAFRDFSTNNPHLELISNDRLVVGRDGDIIMKQGKNRIRLKISQEKGLHVVQNPSQFIFRIKK